MLIEKEKIEKAKASIADETPDLIATLLHIEKWDSKNLKGCCPVHAEDTPSLIWDKKRNSFHCFAEGTMVITKDGIAAIQNLVGKKTEIINGNSEWEKVSFVQCGNQPTMSVELQKGVFRKTIVATPEHEWIIRDSRGEIKIQTKDLRPGMCLAKRWFIPESEIIPDINGMRHGFIFGDGTSGQERRGIGHTYYAKICTKQKKEFCNIVFEKESIKENCPSELKSIPNCCFGRISYTPKDGCDLKALPDVNKSSLEYLYGFIIGLFYSDGNSTDEILTISSANFETLVSIKHMCTLVGLPTYPIGHNYRKAGENLGIVTLKNDHIMYTLCLAKACIKDSFFITERKFKTEHKYNTYLGFKVVSVTDKSDSEPVYCCETSTHSFVLEDFILVGNCFGCNRNIDLIDAYMMTGDTYIQAVQKLFDNAGMKYAFGEVGVKKNRDYRYPHLEDCGTKDSVYKYLDMRCISKDTIDKAGITQDADGNICFNYYDTSDVLTMVKKRPSRKVQHGESKNWCQQGSDTLPLLFNMNKINAAAPLVICEGECDCLALIESGVPNSVSIPLGAGNTHWIEHNWDWLEQFESIIICFDNDAPGVKARKEVVPRLGSWRTKYVEIPHTYTMEDGSEIAIKDVNEVLYYIGREAVVDLISHAEDPGVPSVVNASEVQDMDLSEMDGITTGIRDLDAEIMKLFYGTLTLLSGTPGSGKSSFLGQLLCQVVDQGQPVWMFSREMPGWMEKSWLLHIMAGGHHVMEYESRSGAKYYQIPGDIKKTIDNYYDKKWFLYRDDWSNKVEDLMSSMEDSVRKYGVKLLIIDNLMSIDLGANENSMLLKQTEYINLLIKFAMKYQVAVILVAHPRKLPSGEDVGLYDLSGSANIINLAHRSLALRRVDREKEKSSYDVCLTVLKDRMCGRSGKKIHLYYDFPTRRFYTNESEYNYQYKWDSGKYNLLPYPHREENEVFGSV